MKKLKNSFFNAVIKCWKEISISDKALIIIMIILLIQCIFNLFNPEPTNSNSISINVIIINNDIKTKKLIVAMSIKYLLYTSKNNIPVNNSTKAYLLDIFILQYLHFFPDNK